MGSGVAVGGAGVGVMVCGIAVGEGWAVAVGAAVGAGWQMSARRPSRRPRQAVHPQTGARRSLPAPVVAAWRQALAAPRNREHDRGDRH